MKLVWTPAESFPLHEVLLVNLRPLPSGFVRRRWTWLLQEARAVHDGWRTALVAKGLLPGAELD